MLNPVTGVDSEIYCCHACKEVAALLKESPLPSKPIEAQPGQSEQVTMDIGGLWCASCAWLIEERLKRTGGITSARVSFLERKARITFDNTRIKKSGVVRKIKNLGYRVGEANSLDEEDRFFTRMMVGGLLAMHIMVVSGIMYVRDWMGLSSPDSAWMEHFFFVMQFVLSIPLSILLGFPILRAGLNSLIRGLPNVQTLVALGSLAALGISTRNLFQQTGHVYFDTAAMLFFLLTIGRWLEIKAHQSGQTAFQSLTNSIPAQARRVQPDGESLIAVDKLLPGHRVRVLPGENIPADGVIAWGKGEVDESLLTGEPRPILRTINETVFAGSMNLDGIIEIIISRIGANTRAGQIKNLLDGLVWQRSPVEQLADRIAAWMVYAAVAIASLTFAAYYFQAGLETALLNSLSVLLIACPCALGIATPLTLWQALTRAAENGILLRSSGLFEKLNKIQKIYFDKTGTLTEMEHRVHEIYLEHDTLPEEFSGYVTALEQFSSHPFGQAIITHYGPPSPAGNTVEGFSTMPGAGLAGIVNSMQVFVGCRRMMSDNHLSISETLEKNASLFEKTGQIALFAGWDGRAQGVITIGEKLRGDATSVISDLKRLGLSPAILTGDTAFAGSRWQSILEIPVRAALVPEDKLEIIQQNAMYTMMVGDGINDGPALAAAGIGVAMVHGTDVARSAAEITLIEDNLNAIPWLYRLSIETERKMRQNLAWALVYNIAGIGLAITGLLQPALAALAMVISSSIVTRNALSLRKFPSWKESQPFEPELVNPQSAKPQPAQETA